MKCLFCFKIRWGKNLNELYFQAENSIFLSKSKLQCSNISSTLSSSFLVRGDGDESWSYFQTAYTAFSETHSYASYHLFLVTIIQQRTKLKAHGQQNFRCCLPYKLSMSCISQAQLESFLQKKKIHLNAGLSGNPMETCQWLLT